MLVRRIRREVGDVDALVATDLVVRVGGRTVVEGFDAELRAGEVVAIMGPSGSGKTTLLGVLAGLSAPSSGTVVVREAARSASSTCAQVRAVRPSDVAWVNQRPVGCGRRPAWEVASIGALLAGVREQAACSAASEVLDELGLDGRAHRPYGRLSLGERQRVGVARALLSGRPVVLADEPTASLDGRSAVATIECIRRLRPSQVVVVATHDPAVAARCTRVLRLGEP